MSSLAPDAAAVRELVWRDIEAQTDAAETLQAAVDNPAELAHAWLITGPPGSGRSNIAVSFAASLVAGGDVDTARQVLAGLHPDVSVLKTEGVIIKIKEARDFVARSYLAPAQGRYRVMVIEDADRMTEQTSNVLLKALEEPPEGTVWVLCAPSDADLLPTIRSRVRTLRLKEPEVADVAKLIVERTGVSHELAEESARHAQRHIGMAQRLASDAGARERRAETIETVLGIGGVREAVMAAASIVQLATEDANAFTTEKDAAERAALLRTMGVEEGKAVPPAMRSQLTALEEDQKRRQKRSLIDGIDRVLTDLLSVYRDVLLVKFGRDNDIINRGVEAQIRALADAWETSRTLEVIDHITHSRSALGRNVSPVLALESLFITIAHGRLT